MRRTIVTIVSVAMLIPSAALAVSREDPNDTSGPLDISSTGFTNVRDPARLRFEVRTYGDWSLRRCRRARQLEDGCSIRFWLDTRGAPAYRPTGRGLDYWVAWRIEDCALIDADTSNDIAHGRATKTSDSVTCVIPRATLDIRKKIRWFATTTWADPVDGWYATDYAPDAGWYG